MKMVLIDIELNGLDMTMWVLSFYNPINYTWFTLPPQ